jgi:uncharacterized protein (DUF2062 family)
MCGYCVNCKPTVIGLTQKTIQNMIIQRLHNFLRSLLTKERSPHKLALSVSLGIYIAFCPFIGLHTIMTFLFSWLLGLNLVVVWIVSHIINNPWTMVPVYGVGYLFGNWLLTTVAGFEPMVLNPSWMHWVNGLLYAHIGVPHIAFWSLMLGGNVIGLALALPAYPLCKRIITRLAREKS